MTDQKTEQKPADHKAIREAAEEGPYYTAMVAKPDLRALLADLDAMRGALELICSLDPHESSTGEWNVAFGKCAAAIKGADHE